MGQSDTESTSSSMRGNPGSPRDISVLLDDTREEIAAILNTAFITPEGPSGSTDTHTSGAAAETPKRSSSNSQIPVIDLTSPDGPESSTMASEERNTTGLPEDFIRNYGHAAARLHHRLQLPRFNRFRLDRSRVNVGSRLRRRAGNLASNRGSPRPPSTQQEPPTEEAGAVGGVPCPPVISVPSSDSPIVIDLDEDEGSEASAPNPNPSQGPERLGNVFERFRHVNTSRHTIMEVSRARRMRDSRYARRARHCLDHDELFARQLQEEYNQELDIGPPHSVPLHHVPPDLPAGPVPHPHPYRRRTIFRHPNHPLSSFDPDLLLPFVSVVSVPPPLHHYGVASRLEHMGDAEDYEALWNLTERLGPAKARGLSKEVIDRIPSFRYGAQYRDSSNGKCVVCMMDYSNREKLRRLPCNHDFHSKCVDRWLRSNRTCPVCREVVGS